MVMEEDLTCGGEHSTIYIRYIIELIVPLKPM